MWQPSFWYLLPLCSVRQEGPCIWPDDDTRICRKYWQHVEIIPVCPFVWCQMDVYWELQATCYRVTLIHSTGLVQLGTQPKFACWNNNWSLSTWRTKLHAGKTRKSKTCQGIHHTMIHSHNATPCAHTCYRKCSCNPLRAESAAKPKPCNQQLWTATLRLQQLK